MITILILVGICLCAEAKPNPVVGSYVVDGVQGVLYEVPEYEDPDLALLKLTAMGIMPVLTVLHEADSLDGEDATCLEEFGDVKKGLDGIIVGLEVARDKVEEGSTDIESDIGKSITNLMKLKHHIQVHVNAAPSVDHASVTSYKDGHDGIHEAEIHSTQVATTTASSDIKDDDHIAKILTIGDSIMQTVKSFLKNKNSLLSLNDPLSDSDQDTILDLKFQSTTSSDNTDDGNQDLFEIKTLEDGLMISGTNNKNQDVKKAVFHKKWSWKPAKDESSKDLEA